MNKEVLTFEEDYYGKRVIVKYGEEYRYFIMIEYDRDNNWVHFQVFQADEKEWKYKDILTIAQPISVMEKNLNETTIRVCSYLDQIPLVTSYPMTSIDSDVVPNEV